MVDYDVKEVLKNDLTCADAETVTSQLKGTEGNEIVDLRTVGHYGKSMANVIQFVRLLCTARSSWTPRASWSGIKPVFAE